MNDKINKKTTELGYCCPFAYFHLNQRKSDSLTKLSRKLDVSERTVSYCRARVRDGDIRCQGLATCTLREQLKEKKE